MGISLTTAGPSVSAFFPAALPGCMLGYAADSGVYQDAALTTPATADGATVLGLSDLSGNSRKIVSVTAHKCLLKLNQQNGKPAIRFDGTASYLQTAQFAWAGSPAHVFIVFAQRGWTTAKRIFDGWVNNSLGLCQNNASPEFDQLLGAFACPITGLVLNSFGLVEALFNGTSSTNILNAGAPSTGNNGAPGPGAFTLGGAGGSGTPLAFSQIDVCEVWAFSQQVAGANLTALRTYLNGRWNLY